MRSLVMLAALASVAGCAEPQAQIERVALKSVRVGGAVAYLEIDSVGHVHGGTVTGGPAPVVTEDSATIAPAEARAIFAAVALLGDTLLRHDGAATAEPEGTTVLGVLFDDQSQARVVWRTGTEHPDPRVRAVVERLMRHRIGGL